VVDVHRPTGCRTVPPGQGGRADIPHDATKKSHARERGQFKTVALGVLYGLSAEGLARKLGVSADDFDRLDLVEGMRVAVALPRAEPAELLLMGVSRQPPVVWLELVARDAVRQRMTA
jgi:hypothetical protein